MNVIVVSIILYIILNLLFKYISNYTNNSLCYKIIAVRRFYVKNIHYMPHSRCGISHHLVDIMQVLLLSLILKRKLNCILFYIVVGLWKYMNDYFTLCNIKDSYLKQNYSCVKKYYIVPDSSKIKPQSEYSKIKDSLDENIIVMLHFKVSKYFDIKDIVYINNIFFKNNTNKFDENSIFFLFMNKIYKPSKIISYKVKEYLKQAKKFYLIGMHIRTGIYADFKENAPWFGGINSTSKFIKLALNISNYHTKSKWILCTDSSNISFMIKNKNKKYIMNYNKYFKYSFHLKHSKEYILQRYNIYASSVLIEIELLSHCNYLLLSEGSMVSKIAFIRNKNCLVNRIKCIYIGKNSDNK